MCIWTTEFSVGQKSLLIFDILCKVEKYDLSSVAAIICAAAPLSKEIQSQLFARTKVDRSPKMLLENRNDLRFAVGFT